MLHHHVAYGRAEEGCSELHCLTHQMFGLNIAEKVLNTVCSHTLSLHNESCESSVNMSWIFKTNVILYSQFSNISIEN